MEGHLSLSLGRDGAHFRVATVILLQCQLKPLWHPTSVAYLELRDRERPGGSKTNLGMHPSHPSWGWNQQAVQGGHCYQEG